jgi:hypothetical protein
MKGVVCWFVLLGLAPVLGADSPFVFRKAGPGSVELTETGKPVYVYNYGMILKEGVPEDRRRSSYLHPVYAPDGTVVTDDFPRDHYHHRGIFWTWPVVNIADEEYDLWSIRGIGQRFVRWSTQKVDRYSARLGVENGWYVDHRKVMTETVEVIAHRAEADRRTLDFKLTFEALAAPVKIAGEQAGKGYGGFCIRFGPRKDTVIRTDTGRETEDTNLAPHPWAELEGTFEGGRAGARIEIDPANPGFPNGWCLRHYGFLGVNFPGLQAWTLEPGKPLALKYRVTVYSAAAK